MLAKIAQFSRSRPQPQDREAAPDNGAAFCNLPLVIVVGEL
jgi:hypothetical protein